jgi:hypothetical protein
METVIGTLAEVSGHTYDTIYRLFFTTERIIACLVRSPTDVPPKTGMLEMVVIGNWRTRGAEKIEKQKIADQRTQDLNEKSPEELLNSHRLNRELRYDNIETVEIKSGLLGSSLRFRGIDSSGSGFKVNFSLGKDQVPVARELLGKVLSEKIIK